MLFAFIDQQVELLEPALQRNFERWPVLDEYVWPNAFVFETYEEEIDFMKSFIEIRSGWIDDNIYGNCTILSSEETKEEPGPQIRPNPVANRLNIFFRSPLTSKTQYRIYNLLGQEFGQGEWESGLTKPELEISHLANGIYEIAMFEAGKVKTLRFAVVN